MPDHESESGPLGERAESEPEFSPREMHILSDRLQSADPPSTVRRSWRARLQLAEFFILVAMIAMVALMLWAQVQSSLNLRNDLVRVCQQDNIERADQRAFYLAIAQEVKHDPQVLRSIQEAISKLGPRDCSTAYSTQ